MSKELVAALNDLAAKLNEAEDIEERLAKDKAEVKSTKEMLDGVKKDLADANTGLSAAQRKNLIAADEEIRAKLADIDSINRKAIDAKQALDEVNAELKLATARHEGMEASIAAMRQKFA